MGGVDIANQLRASFTTLRPQNLRYWYPLFYLLLDIALTNSYLLALAILGPSRGHRDCQRYSDNLLQALITYPSALECAPEHALEHNYIHRVSRDHCAYCSKNQLSWQPKHFQPGPRPKAFGIVITNNEDFMGDKGSRKQFQGSKTQ